MLRTVRTLLLLALASPASAHEVLHEVQRGRAVAVRSWHSGGEGLAHARAEVFSPADPAIPHWTGRTDGNGWVAFVPDAPGAWRVRILDDTGHGLDTVVEVPALSPGGPGTTATGSASPLLLALRPVVGVALIGVVFAVVYLVARRRRRGPPGPPSPAG